MHGHCVLMSSAVCDAFKFIMKERFSEKVAIEHLVSIIDEFAWSLYPQPPLDESKQGNVRDAATKGAKGVENW